MKKSTGIWVVLATLAAGAAIGSMCVRHKCGCGACQTDKHPCHGDQSLSEKKESLHDLKSELMDQIEKVKNKLSALL